MVLYKKMTAIFAVLLIFLSSCEFESYEDYGFDSYDGAFKWTRLVKNAGWGNRYGHAAVAYKGKLWVMGGYNPGKVSGDTYYEDVWCSQDGIEWCEVLDDAPWKGRRGHRVVVFNDGNGDAIYLSGGFSVNEETGYRHYANDVWKTYNGADWILVKDTSSVDYSNQDDWFPRFNHGFVAATHSGTNYLYIIGGATMLEDHNAQYATKYFNDVWRSTDGASWEKLDNNDYGIRSEAGVTVDPETGKIFMQGGNSGLIFIEADSTNAPRDDWHWIWTSEDGVNWIPENDTANLDQGFLWRADHKLVFLNNTLWGLPGKTTSKVHYHFTNSNHIGMWRRDGKNLYGIDSEGIDIDARHGYATAVLNDKLYILGGFTSSFGQSNDVWTGEL